MKSGPRDIIGKTIAQVIVAKNDRDPRQQVFIVFDDDTWFEFYGASFNCAGGVSRGTAADARDYAERCCTATIEAVYPQPG